MNTRTERIRQLRDEGKTLTQIAREFGLSRERIRQICNQAGIPTVTPHSYVPLICAVCGNPYDPAGRDLNSRWGGARTHLREFGHHTRPRKTTAPWQPNERALRIIALKETGHSIAQIHRDMGITASYVQTILHRAGVSKGVSRHAERDASIIEAWRARSTYASIQERFGLSYGRVRQIISGHIGQEENHGR